MTQKRKCNSAFAVFAASLCLVACAISPPDTPLSIRPLSPDEAETLSGNLRLFEDKLEEKRDREFRRLYGDDDFVTVTGSRVQSSPASITNNQVEGVDEGDIVKQLGNYLVALRRGRLFSFELGSSAGSVRAVNYIDVESLVPDEDGYEIDAWYDEILVYDETLILLGYSYEYQGSVIHRYRLREDGSFERLGEVLLRSGDYFDTSNYATRIVGNQLILYLPRPFVESSIGIDVHEIVAGSVQEEPRHSFEETIYTPLQHSLAPLRHSILSCPLDRAEFSCSARSIVGPRASIFYISADAFYLWLNSADWAYNFRSMGNGQVRKLAWRLDEDFADDEISVVYRIPLDQSPVEVVRARGWPVNQFSFDETPRGLRVFVWEQVDNIDDEDDAYDRDLAWLDISRENFSSNLAVLPDRFRKPLNIVEDDVGDSRFVGPYLLYSELIDNWPDREYDSRLWIKRLDREDAPMAIPFEGGEIQRIEPLDQHAVVLVQKGQELEASTIWLGDYAELGTTLTFARSSQADRRSHGFNYRWSDGEGGVFAFPVFEASDNEDPRRLDWYDDPVTMEFVGVSADLRTYRSGQLRSNEQLLDVDDNCIVSCVDWYGEARPFFVGDRVFALIDYELIEAAGYPSSIVEVDRENALTLLGE